MTKTMGLDLALIIDQWPRVSELPTGGKLNILGYTRIGLDRDYELFDSIKALKPAKLDGEIGWYDEEGLEQITEDKYGQPLTYLLAGEIKKCVDVPYTQSASALSPLNRAVVAYLMALDPERRVVLFWH